MRIACLQFAPQVGDVNNNLNRADSVLSRANPQDLDLLVLPELAFTGYNFRSLHHISPYLEPTTSGITSLWARTTALKYNCVVTAGYPEKVDLSPKWPASPEYYNSAITVNADGETIANYRKSFLFYTDETWALEGPDGFYDGVIDGLGNVAMGICMDLNPYKFEAAWNAWEFAHHVLHRQANLIILSMAWMTRENARSFSRTPKEPDMDTLSYWLARLEPIIRNEGEEEIIAVFANRTGNEENATYAGTSAVLGIQAGEVKVYGILGRGERELLVVDTSIRPKLQLVSEPRARMPQAPTVGPGSSAAAALDKISVAAPDDIPGTRSSTSSDSAADSDQSLSSKISISTGHTSLDPPQLDPCSFSPVSPVENPVPQAYFPEKFVSDMPPPELKRLKERQPTPIPASSEPTKAVERFPTPVPVPSVYSRPQSPKSRNCSRSRGPTLQDSPPLNGSMSRMGNIRSDEERLQQDSPLLGSMSMIGQGIDVDEIIEDDLDPNEIIYIEDEDSPPFESLVGNILGDARQSRVDFMAKHINNIPTQLPTRPVASKIHADSNHTPPDTPPSDTVLVDRSWSRSRIPADMDNESKQSLSALCANILASPTFNSICSHTRRTETVPLDHSRNQTRAEMEIDKRQPFPSITPDTQPFESSFTRNPLGPRSQHIVPRPLSTIW